MVGESDLVEDHAIFHCLSPARRVSGNLEETPDLDDLEVLEKIVAQAVDVKKLQSKRVEGFAAANPAVVKRLGGFLAAHKEDLSNNKRPAGGPPKKPRKRKK